MLKNLLRNGKGNQYQTIVDAVSVSGTKSLQLWGKPGWGALALKNFAFDSEIIGNEASRLYTSDALT